MPRNSFPLSIGVSGKEYFFGVFHQPGQPGQNIFAPVRGEILRFEVGSGHAHFLDGQIAHMADRGGDLPAGAEDFLHLFHFTGGFQNQQFRAHDVSLKGRQAARDWGARPTER